MKENIDSKVLIQVLKQIILEYQRTFKHPLEISDKVLMAFSKDYQDYVESCNVGQISAYSEIVTEIFPYTHGRRNDYKELISYLNKYTDFRIEIVDVFLILIMGMEENSNDHFRLSPYVQLLREQIKERFDKVKN